MSKRIPPEIKVLRMFGRALMATRELDRPTRRRLFTWLESRARSEWRRSQ